MKNFLFKVKNFLSFSLFLFLFLIFNINSISTEIDNNYENFKNKKITHLQRALNRKKNQALKETFKIKVKNSTYNFYKEKYFKLGKYYYFLDNLNVIYKATDSLSTINNNNHVWWNIYNHTDKNLFLLQDNKIIKKINAATFYKTNLKNFFKKIKSQTDNLKTSIENKKITSVKKWNINFNIERESYSKNKILKFLKDNLKEYLIKTKEKIKKINFNENKNLLYMYFSPKKDNLKIASFSWYEEKDKTAQIVYKLNSSKNKVIEINCFGIKFNTDIAFEKSNLNLLKDFSNKNKFATWKIILILVGVLIIIIFTVWLKFKDSRW